MKKYEFTGETMEFEGHTLRRIRYLKNVNAVAREGKIGGWIEDERNLSHEGTCAVRGEAKVFGNARLIENADVFINAIVKDNVLMKGHSHVTRNAIVGGDTILDDSTWITDNSKVFFYAQALDEDSEKPHISGKTRVLGKSIIEATGYIRNSYIDNLSLSGNLSVENDTFVKKR